MLSRPQRGIKGGFSIRTLPDALSSPARQFSWENRKPKDVQAPEEAVAEMRKFLSFQGHEVTNDELNLIREHARAQYCSSEIGRCPPPKKNKAQKAAEAAGPNLPWASGYWKTANMVLAEDADDPVRVVASLMLIATTLITGKDGCEKCASHLAQILGAVDYRELIKSSNDARIFWWVFHNATREGKPETPYVTIAKAWKWPELTPDVIKEAVTRMNLTALP